MINYLVQSFSGFVERGFVKLRRKPWFRSSFLFSELFGWFSLSVFSELGYINRCFSLIGRQPFKITGRCSTISSFLGLAGPLSTYFAGKYTRLVTACRSTGSHGWPPFGQFDNRIARVVNVSINDGDLTRINLRLRLILCQRLSSWVIWLARFSLQELVMIRLWIRTIFINLRQFVPGVSFIPNLGCWS